MLLCGSQLQAQVISLCTTADQQREHQNGWPCIFGAKRARPRQDLSHAEVYQCVSKETSVAVRIREPDSIPNLKMSDQVVTFTNERPSIASRMAERPDLEYQLPLLTKALVGQTVASATLVRPVVLRMLVVGDVATMLAGQQIANVWRRGHFIGLRVEPSNLEVIFSPMLAGRFQFYATGDKRPRDAAFDIHLANGQTLCFRDDVQMGKVYVGGHAECESIAGYATTGLDVLNRKQFTWERFVALAKKRRDQARVFVMDKAALDSFGNAYADEVLFVANIHPKTWVRDLSEADLQRLFAALTSVLRDAIAELKKRKPPLDEKLRDFLQVRRHHGEPCPVCGTTIRKAGVHGHDAYFCPTCQPETRKTGVVSWGKV